MNFTGVVIPFYKGEEFIEKCVGSILANGVPARHVYIVDNSPRETAAEVWKALSPDLQIIRTKPGLGFGRACNIGAAAALKDGANQLLVTNQDTILDQGSIASLVRALVEHPPMSLVAPLNYTYGFETMESQYVRYFLSQSPSLISDAIDGQLKGIYEVEKIVGSCFLVRSESVCELGLFDELYFMYSEDEDLCRRYRLAGHQIALLPSARVAHAHSLTAEDNEKQVDCWTRRSRQLFTLKDTSQPLWKCVALVLYMSAFEYVRAAAKLDLRSLVRFAQDDLYDLGRVGAILHSRRKESAILKTKRVTTQLSNSPITNLLSPPVSRKS